MHECPLGFFPNFNQLCFAQSTVCSSFYLCNVRTAVLRNTLPCHYQKLTIVNSILCHVITQSQTECVCIAEFWSMCVHLLILSQSTLWFSSCLHALLFCRVTNTKSLWIIHDSPVVLQHLQSDSWQMFTGTVHCVLWGGLLSSATLSEFFKCLLHGKRIISPTQT